MRTGGHSKSKQARKQASKQNKTNAQCQKKGICTEIRYASYFRELLTIHEIIDNLINTKLQYQFYLSFRGNEIRRSVFWATIPSSLAQIYRSSGGKLLPLSSKQWWFPRDVTHNRLPIQEYHQRFDLSTTVCDKY
jgi:hypothetical protein